MKAVRGDVGEQGLHVLGEDVVASVDERPGACGREQAEAPDPEIAAVTTSPSNNLQPALAAAPLLQLASNQGPVRVQYGPVPSSRLVTVEE